MRRALLLLSFLFAVGCPEPSRELVVDLKTDYVPGVDFVATRVRAFAALGDESALATQDGPAALGDDFARGERIGELGGLPSGGSVMLVTELLGPGGERVASQVTAASLRFRVGVVTVLITRDCREVTCPADDPSATACLGGVCVEPQCAEESREGCAPAPECTFDADCETTSPCARAACEGGVCFAFPGDTCGPDAYCDPDVGCTPLGAPTDAGVDAGADAGTDAGTPRCPSADADAVALYTFEGGALTDMIGDRDITSVGGDLATAPGPDDCGDGIAFPSAADVYGLIADDAAWELTEGSVDFWFRYDGSSADAMHLFSRDHSGLTPPGQLQAGISEERRLYVRIQGTDGQGIRCSPPGVTADEWHHVGINFGAPDLEIWLDGAVVDDTGTATFRNASGGASVNDCGTASASHLAGTAGAIPWYIGANNGYSTPGTTDAMVSFFHGGALDHFRISSVRRDFSSFSF